MYISYEAYEYIKFKTYIPNASNLDLKGKLI